MDRNNLEVVALGNIVAHRNIHVALHDIVQIMAAAAGVEDNSIQEALNSALKDDTDTMEAWHIK